MSESNGKATADTKKRVSTLERHMVLAEAVQDGTSILDVADERGISPATVRIACQEVGIKPTVTDVRHGPVRRDIRRDRRYRMAVAVAEGATIAKAARMFQVTQQTVKSAIKEFNAGYRDIKILELERKLDVILNAASQSQIKSGSNMSDAPHGSRELNQGEADEKETQNPQNR